MKFNFKFEGDENMISKRFGTATLVVATLFLVSMVAVVYAQVAAPPTSPSVHKETIATFCDSSADHGSSTSCKGEGEFTNYVCDSGTFSGRGSCSVGQECTENGQTGHYCDCEANCRDN